MIPTDVGAFFQLFYFGLFADLAAGDAVYPLCFHPSSEQTALYVSSTSVPTGDSWTGTCATTF
jgi:hypothetical protein